MIQVLFQTKKLIKLPQIVPLLHIYPLREPDPSSVQFTFIKTEGSQEHGILMTHQSAFKWHNQHVSKDGMT